MTLRLPTFLLAVMAIVALAAAPRAQIALPVTFEDTALDYEIRDFESPMTTLVTDPTDASNRVAQTVRPTTAVAYAGTVIADVSGFTPAIPFEAGSTTMSMRVWTPVAGTPVRLKVEDKDDPTHSVEVELTTTVGMAWETLVFDFSTQLAGTAAINFSYTYNKAAIFFDFGVTGASEATTYYWDDLAFGGAAASGGIALPVTFDEMIDYQIRDFESPMTTIVADPADAANMVAQTVRPTDAVSYAGTVIADTDGFASPIPFEAGATTMTLRVWAPAVGTTVRVKVENTAGGPTAEAEVATTTGMAWETLVFDFSTPVAGAPVDPAATYNKAVVFFDFGLTGASEATTYYWDDLAFGGAPTPGGIALPVTFEDTALDYEIRDFESPMTTLVTDPTDASNRVAQTIRPTDAVSYAGTVIADVSGFASPIPFTASATTMSMRVWTPAAGTPVRVKVENTAGGPTAEAEVATTTGMAWETLVFDFSTPVAGAPVDPAATYNKAVVFFDFGLTGASEATTYYWDDLAFGGETPPAPIMLPVTFEEMIDYELRDFESPMTTIIEDPTDATNTVARTIRPTDAVSYAGTVIADVSGFASPIPFTADATTMSLRVWAPAAGIPVRFKVENTAGGPTAEAEVMTTVAMAWETIVFDLAAPVAGAPVDPAATYNKAVVFFDFGRTGAPEAATYYWDDLAFGGTVTPPPTPVVSLPVTLEEDIDYDLRDFEGAITMLIEDPTDASNTVAEVTRPAGAGFAAGTVIADQVGFTEAIPFAEGDTKMNLRVWTAAAGTPVRLKVEKVGDPTISVEAQVNTTQNGAWEILTFDFANQAEGTAAINFGSTYNKAVIFFDFGVTDATEATTYYWDDLAFGEYIPGVANENGVPTALGLEQNFPNPFTAATSFRIALPTAGHVSVDVFNVLGQRVATVVDGPMEAGTHVVSFNASGLAGGTYFYRLNAGEVMLTKSMVLIR